jgi:hypothetical protein
MFLEGRLVARLEVNLLEPHHERHNRQQVLCFLGHSLIPMRMALIVLVEIDIHAGEHSSGTVGRSN